jgi:DNA polymerase (family 10)
MLAAVESPFVDMVGHPTGRLLLARDAYPLDLERVIDAAAELGVALEINAHPHRLDMDWEALRAGRKRGLRTAINPDAHHPDGLADVEYGIGVARKAWCTVDDVMNAWPLSRFLDALAERRERALSRVR